MVTVRDLRDCCFFFVQVVVQINGKIENQESVQRKKAWRGKRRREQNGRWMGQIIEMLRGEAEGRWSSRR